MKITFFIGSLYGGGAERVTCNLASYFVQQGNDAEILTMSETEDAYELDPKVSVQHLLRRSERGNKVMNSVLRLRRLRKYLKTKDRDVYVVMLPKTTILFLLLRKLTKAKVICAERVDPASYSKTIGGLLKRYAYRADGFVFQTEDARSWYGESVRNVKTTVIPNAVNPQFIRERYAGEKEKSIAAVGRLKTQKNFPLLIKAFASVVQEYPEYRLVIYGEGEQRSELEKLAESLGISGHVLLPGNVQDIADKLEKSTMFVLSSDFEGMPNALIEAMALGLPCVSTDCPCGGPKYLIEQGKNGILVPVGDVDALSQAIRSLLSDPEKREQIGKNASAVCERLAPEKIYGRWEEFTEEILRD